MKKALLLLTIFVSFSCYAQTDTAFWFAAPDVSDAHQLPIHFRISSYQQPCTITISQPAGGGLPPQTFTLAPNTSQSVNLSAWLSSIECTPGNAVQNKGIKITSTNKISVYYEINANQPSPELFVLKGKNALGNDFYISSQNILSNSTLHTPPPKSSFNIVATEDNTSVTITPTNNIVGHAANIPFTINLNKGQTYAAIAISELASLHLQGSHVTSTKPIAITLADDLLQGGPVYGGFCQDLTGDQTVPINKIGNEYIAIKSNLNSPFDKIYITASQNSTSVTQDGVFVTNLNTGQSVELPVTNNSTYIQSSAPVYAFQLSGVGCEMSSTLLPKISCTGSSSVTTIRSSDESFYVTLLVKNGGQNNFLVNNVAGVITAAQFSVVPATGGLWYAAKVLLPISTYPNGSAINISNSTSVFQMGVLQGGVLSGFEHGYFSDYNSFEAHASASATTFCIGSNIQLFADFISSATYSWTGPNSFASNLQNPIIPNAALVNSGMYHLTVNIPGCGAYLDSVPVIVQSCQVLCNNWLNTPVQSAFVNIGDLDVPGNQITVEALANKTAPGFDIVSKHADPSNVNYLLRPIGAEITTTTGYAATPPVCDVELNKTYHYAMVYDGVTLKYYRNGFLMSQVAKTGNMIQNNLNTNIGWLSNQATPAESFVGYINEVRIWNVARTQSQIQTYMNSSLPNPTSQPGLLAYYTFDNLLNKQGNAAWNGTLGGAATINSTNPNCTFIADSCAITTPATNISGIINDYTPIQAYNICDNKLTVEDATKFNAGDTVLMIQMKGAAIDSTNTANFGTITDYKNAGNYEFNYVKSKVGNIIELKNTVLRQYDIPAGKAQLVRVPYYTSVNVNGSLTCLPWDGSKGGVLVLNVRDTLNLSADVDVSGRGFKGSQPITTIPGTGIFNQVDYAYPANAINGTRKGEGIAEVSENLIFCRGPLGSGGGGGNSSNAGGGGGGNGGSGGRGGNEWGGSPTVLTNGGVGGKNCVYSGGNNKIFMGGAGGAGQANDGTGTAGGNGGAIAIINSSKIIPNSFKIVANGLQGPDCINISVCADGVGGGGAGGTVMINTQTITGNLPVQTNGGKGADNNIGGPNAHGPGGGGGGGSLLVNSAALLGNITFTSPGGAAGRAINQGNTNWGALAGNNGISTSGFLIPFTTTAFKKNIDSVRIKDSVLLCNSYDFKGLAYTNTNLVTNWQWSFGDGGTATTQNTTHTYAAAGTYNVKLIVTDINGCRDSISKNVTTGIFTADAGRDTAICTNNAVSVKLNASAGTTWAWTPATQLNNATIQSPTATISTTTRFYVTITNSLGCVGTDSVTVTIAPPVPNIRYQTVTAFTNQSVQLQARNLGGNSYLWLPSTGLNNNIIINPLFNYNQSQEFKISIKNALGCIITDTVLVTIKGKKGIYVPKAFSPNSDGVNDRLYPILVGISKLNYFRVYNRWGNLVFETNTDNPAAGWNGLINGYPQPPETYTWTAEGIDIDGIVIKKSGNTFLIR